MRDTPVATRGSEELDVLESPVPGPCSYPGRWEPRAGLSQVPLTPLRGRLLASAHAALPAAAETGLGVAPSKFRFERSGAGRRVRRRGCHPPQVHTGGTTVPGGGPLGRQEGRFRLCTSNSGPFSSEEERAAETPLSPSRPLP